MPIYLLSKKVYTYSYRHVNPNPDSHSTMRVRIGVTYTAMQRRIGTLVRNMLLLENPQFLPKIYETLPK